MDATGVVLAGGRSSRFGRDKLAADLDGAPLLHHAIRNLSEECRSVIVVLPAEGAEPRPPRGIDVRFVRDEVADQGPLRGAVTGLGAVETDWSLLVGGDMPAVPVAILRLLLERAGDAAGAVLDDGGRIRPLPSALRTAPARDRAGDLLAGGERRLRRLLEHDSIAVVEESTWLALDPGRRALVDVDEPTDLERLRREA